MGAYGKTRTPGRHPVRTLRDTITFEGDLKGNYEVRKSVKDALLMTDDIDNMMSGMGFTKEVRVSGVSSYLSKIWYKSSLSSQQIKKETVEKLLRRGNNSDTTTESEETVK